MRIGQPVARIHRGRSMLKLLYHNLFSIAFVIVRVFVVDAAASPAHGKDVVEARYVVSAASARLVVDRAVWSD